MRLVFLTLLLGYCSAQALGQIYNPRIDVEHYTFALQVNDESNVIKGNATVSVLFKENAPTFSLDLVRKNEEGKGMTVTEVKEGARPLRFSQNSETLIIFSAAKTGSRHSYTIVYTGIPRDGLIISNNKFGKRGFFGDNWPNRAHNWLPCVDHPSDKATVDFEITAPDHYKVVANGSLQEEKALPGHLQLTRWKEAVPLSPKVMVVGIAEFAVDHPGDAMGIPVWDYVYKEEKAQGFKAYANALKILPFYIQHIGPFPFEKCGNVQSKTIFGGLENASAIFYYENSVEAADIESLMAHEIAHQWFGDAATETQWKHLWLSEGFATYMTHCYLENQYGPDTLKRGMAQDRKTAIAFEKRRLTPIVDTSIKENYMLLLNPNNYQKGGWVLHMLRRTVGDELFWKGVSTYYTTYRNSNASSEDFEKIMETVSGKDLHAFFHDWLDKPGHPHIRIDWKYDLDKKALVLDITRTGEQQLDLPLELAADGVAEKTILHGTHTHAEIPFPEKPVNILPDPNVDLLADFETHEQ